MTRPAWLPPLNSHEDYSINVSIHQCNHPSSSKRSKPPRNMKTIAIILFADVKFYSDDINKQKRSPFNGLSLCHGSRFRRLIPASDVDLRKSVDRTLRNRELVPFKLDKIGCYREADELEPMLDQSYDNQLHSQHDLVGRIIDFFFCTMNQYSQLVGRQTMAVLLFIKKSVMIPDRKLEAWTSWYEEQKRANLDDFEEDYLRAMCVPRTIHELRYKSSLLAYESLAKSCIESPEKLALEEVGDSETKSCTICLEDMRKGEQVTKLPCLHVFHGDCVIHSLKTSHFSLYVVPCCLVPTSS